MTDETQLLPLRQAWRLWWDHERSRTSGGGPIARIGQIAQRGGVLRELIVRGLKSDYGSSVLGYAWTLFTPLTLIGVYWLVFAHVVNLKLQHYPLFIAAGIFPWVYFNSTFNASMAALRSDSGIIRTINMPREIFPLAVVGQAALEYVLSIPVIFIFGFAYGVLPSRYVFLLPLSILIETVLLVGIALLFSALTTLVADVPRVVRPLLRVLFYLSPILYPVSKVHSGIALVFYKMNPLVGIVELSRIVWYPHYLVPTPQIFQHALISAAMSVVILIIGWASFIRLEPSALKEL